MFVRFLPQSNASGRVLEIKLPHSINFISKNVFLVFPNSKLSFETEDLSEMETFKRIFPPEKQFDICMSGQVYEIPVAPFFRLYYMRKWNF